MELFEFRKTDVQQITMSTTVNTHIYTHIRNNIFFIQIYMFVCIFRLYHFVCTKLTSARTTLKQKSLTSTLLSLGMSTSTKFVPLLYYLLFGKTSILQRSIIIFFFYHSLPLLVQLHSFHSCRVIFKNYL